MVEHRFRKSRLYFDGDIVRKELTFKVPVTKPTLIRPTQITFRGI